MKVVESLTYKQMVAGSSPAVIATNLEGYIMTGIDPRDSMVYGQYVDSMKRFADLHMYEMMRMDRNTRMQYLCAEIEKLVSPEFINAHIVKKEWFLDTMDSVVSSIFDDVHQHFTAKAEAFIKTYINSK